uniref:C4b-binding protein alpha chain-like n=1 Tax=Myripristis murdjan TaxID=586833 RepID=A0A667Z844_9TELE
MKPVGVSFLLLLSTISLTGIAQAQNCSVPVAGPNMHLSENDIFTTHFENGSEVTFVCDVGYASAGGARKIICIAGTWSQVNLKCERKNCGSPGEVENGEFLYQDTLFGDKAVARCNPGYMMVGQNERICRDGGWSGRVPVCEVVTCEPPPQVENASPFTPQRDSYSYRDVVQYKCQKDFTLNGSSSLTCSENGHFTPDPPKCIKVICEDPNIANAHFESGARPPYGYKAFVVFRCNTGFVMEGRPGLTCTIDGQWSPKPPICKLDATVPPPTGSSHSHAVGIGIGVAVAVVIVATGIYLYAKRNSKKKNHTLGDDDAGKSHQKDQQEPLALAPADLP